jgi:FkbM family methyltransferase
MDYLGFFSNRQLTYLLKDGVKFDVRSGGQDALVIGDVWVRQVHTPPDLRIRRHDIVVDVGAHIGIFSIFAAIQASRGTVYAYEPESENFDLLEHNIRLNRSRNIKAFCFGLSGKSEKRKLFLSSRRKTAHGFYVDSEDSVEIQCVTLKDVFDANGLAQIDFLKLDCEGAEYEILLGTPRDYLSRIRRISLEFHDGVMGHKHRELRDFLEKEFSLRESREKHTNLGFVYATNRGIIGDYAGC